MSLGNQSMISSTVSSLGNFVLGDPPVSYLLTLVVFVIGAIVGWAIVE